MCYQRIITVIDSHNLFCKISGAFKVGWKSQSQFNTNDKNFNIIDNKVLNFPLDEKSPKIQPIDQKEIINFLTAKKLFNPKQQYDCLEIISIIVSTLSNEFSNMDINPIDEMFYGKLREEYMCLNPNCTNTKISYNNFESINFTLFKGKNNFKDLMNKWSSWNK